jgi:VWFA-related protein
MTRIRRLSCFVGSVATVAAVVAAQTAEQQPPVFRSGVNVVEVDVRVFDRDGRFVRDLKPEEFELRERGEVQAIQASFLIEGSAGASSRVLPPPVTSGGSSAPPAPAPQTWVFVFDTNHLLPGAGFERARDAVAEFIKTDFREGDVGGVIAGGKMANNRLTSVREELTAATRAVKPNSDVRSRSIELTREWPRLQDEYEAILIAEGNADALRRAVIRACGDDPDACRQVPPDTTIMEKARRCQAMFDASARASLNTLNALASGLARVAGPKTIVFLSEGFVTERRESGVQQAVGQTTRAGGRVYAIDVRGLNRGRGAGLIDQPTASDEVGGPAQFDMIADGPNSLAVDTGGLMIRNQNNIGAALERIAADSGTYYVLAYRPTDAAFDGKYRPIEVRVTRPDVQVRARRGYLAIEPARLLTPQPIKTDERPSTAAKPATASTSASTAPTAVDRLPAPVTGTVVSGAAPSGSREIRLRPDAVERVKEIAGSSGKEPGSTAANGWTAYERGDVESAVGSFAAAANEAGVRPWVLYALGLSYTALGKHADAAAAWERVKQAAPEFSAVYIDLADAYLQQSDSARALQVLRDGSTRWPTDPEFHNAIGVIHVRRGAFDDGIEAFTRAAAVAPDEPLAYFNLGRAYQLRFSRDTRYVASQRRWIAPEGDRQKAIEFYQKYLKLGGPYATQAADAIRTLEWAK